MKLIRTISLVLVLVMIATVPVFANYATTTTEPEIDIEEIKVGNFEMFTPTASYCKIGGEDAELPTSFLFDRSSDTQLHVSISEASVLEVYTSTSVTRALAAFGILAAGEVGTTLEITVYASNDAYSDDWDHLLLEMDDPEQIGDYQVIKIGENYIGQYLYYRFEITAERLGDISLIELAMFKSNSKGPELEWDLTLETPKLVPVGTAGKPQKKGPSRAFMNNLYRLALVK